MTCCWCGCSALSDFSDDYLRCPTCETLVWRETGAEPGSGDAFYGKDYFFGHQTRQGLPDLYSRARSDLTDRCPHWLKTLLRHRPPPARVLEIGCSHGAYLALLSAAGYDARGLDLSPWVVEFAREQFGVQADAAALDQAPLVPASFDVIVMNDVLEHLPDPSTTIQRCAGLLSPGGLLVVQTPHYPAGASYQDLQASGTPFLKMLLPREHLHLFSQTAALELCKRAGLPAIVFEPAYFTDQDMFFFASTVEWQPLPEAQPLQNGASGRLAQALLDLHAVQQQAQAHRVEIDMDRAARLEQILNLTAEAHKLQDDLSAARQRAAELARIPPWLPRWLIHRAARLFRQK